MAKAARFLKGNQMLAFPKITAQSIDKRERSRIEADCERLFSQIVRARDGYHCQWCTSKTGNVGAHHIVPRSLCNLRGHYDTKNGMALCDHCHIVRVQMDPEAYFDFRDRWLSARGLSYENLRIEFSQRNKTSLGDLVTIRTILKQRLAAL